MEDIPQNVILFITEEGGKKKEKLIYLPTTKVSTKVNRKKLEMKR